MKANNTTTMALHKAVRIPSGKVELEGELTLPEKSHGIVLFAHGSGSSRHSPRNQFVAQALQKGGLGTLLFDLLTEQEEEVDMRTLQLRFDINFLAGRLADATRWLTEQPELNSLRPSYFGSSTGGGAALVAASHLPDTISAVVSRGGRPDLAGAALSRVKCPTLLIVGGNDQPVIEMNEEALKAMFCEKELKIVPGASHLFEESGKLEEVARLAVDWFNRHLQS